jgi:inorganic pyrophosphatase
MQLDKISPRGEGRHTSSLNFKRLQDIGDLDDDMLEQIQEFFVSYNEEAGKKFKVEKILGAKKARELARPK